MSYKNYDQESSGAYAIYIYHHEKKNVKLFITYFHKSTLCDKVVNVACLVLACTKRGKEPSDKKFY